MAKKEIGRNGKLTLKSKAKKFRQSAYEKLDKELREQVPPQLGPRAQVLHAYEEKKSREYAYYMADTINQKIGEEAYTREIVDHWIDEYEKQKKGIERDEDAR